jgi:hypothetical protein
MACAAKYCICCSGAETVVVVDGPLWLYQPMHHSHLNVSFQYRTHVPLAELVHAPHAGDGSGIHSCLAGGRVAVGTVGRHLITHQDVPVTLFNATIHAHAGKLLASMHAPPLHTSTHHVHACMHPLQVLKVLSNPSHPDLVPGLRSASTNISANNVRDLHLWLEGGLFTHLLRILEALPSLDLSPSNAADVCASAAAVLSNVVLVSQMQDAPLPPSITPQSILAAAGTLEMVGLVVQFGMTGAAALEPLSGPTMHVELLEPTLAKPPNRTPPVWTPLQVCSYLLEEVLIFDEAIRDEHGVCVEAAARKLGPAFRRLVDTAILQHLLENAMEHPAGARLRLLPLLLLAPVRVSCM